MALIDYDYMSTYTKSLANVQSGTKAIYLITVSRLRESGTNDPFSFQFLYNEQVTTSNLASVVKEVFDTNYFPVTGSAYSSLWRRFYYRGCYKNSTYLELTYIATYYGTTSTDTYEWTSLNVDCIELG